MSSATPIQALAQLPAIALALRDADISVLEAAAVQLRDLVVAPDAAADVCAAVANHSEVVDAAFVRALGRPGLSAASQHALVLAMMTIFRHDDTKDASTPLMRSCPLYLPVLLRIIAQELPVSTCR
jgi:hypothetical protein